MTAAAESRSAFRPAAGWWRWLRSPFGVHYLLLAVTAVVLVVLSTKSWFFFDDWAFLVPSEGNIWAPHVGHWSTTPFLVFLGLRDVFGLNSYVPFAIPVIVAQLGLAHLIWRFCLKVGVRPIFATTLTMLLLCFGAGSENVLWAFQLGFVGAMALGMVVVVVFLRDALRLRDVVVVMVASIVALSCSGSAIPVLAAAAAIGWSRRGFLRTTALLLPAGVAYLAWYIAFGRFSAPNGQASGLNQLLFGVPTFAIKMLTDGLGRAFPIAVLGPLLFATLAVWAVLSFPRATRTARPAYLLALAAPFFALITGYSRVGLGLDTATSSRYLFFIIPMMLPLMGIMIGAAVTRARFDAGAVVVILLVIVIYNAGGLVGSVAIRDSRSDATRERLSAAVELAADYPDANPAVQPGGEWAPDVRLSDLEVFRQNRWFQPTRYGQVAALSARGDLGIEAVTATAPVDEAGCTRLSSASGATVFRSVRLLVRSSIAASIVVAVRDGASTGDGVPVQFAAGWEKVSLAGPSSGYGLEISHATTDVEVCPTR